LPAVKQLGNDSRWTDIVIHPPVAALLGTIGALRHFCCSWPAVRYDGAIGPSDMWAMLTDRFTEKSEENP